MSALSKIIRGMATGVSKTIGETSSKVSGALFGQGKKSVTKVNVPNGQSAQKTSAPRSSDVAPKTNKLTSRTPGVPPAIPKRTGKLQDPFQDLSLRSAKPEEVRLLATKKDQDGNNMLHRLAGDINKLEGSNEHKIEAFLDQLAYCKECLGDKKFKTLLQGDVNDKNRNALSIMRQELARCQFTQETVDDIRERFDIDVYVPRNKKSDGWKM